MSQLSSNTTYPDLFDVVARRAVASGINGDEVGPLTDGAADIGPLIPPGMEAGPLVPLPKMAAGPLTPPGIEAGPLTDGIEPPRVEGGPLTDGDFQVG